MTKRYRRMLQIYARFATAAEYPQLDFSDAAAEDMYKAESRGVSVAGNNGWAVAKSWMDVTIAMWRRDVADGILFKWELATTYPEHFIRSAVGDVPQGRHWAFPCTLTNR